MIVCFTDSGNFGTWKLFTFWRKGFAHCFVVDYDPDMKVWYKAECASERMSFIMYDDVKADYLIGNLVENAHCLEVREVPKRIYFPRWLYCVSFVKHLIGMRKWWILTPYQLYCELRKNGANSIFEKELGE